MTSLQYRLTLIVCMIAWLLVGLHVPVLHELVDPSHDPNMITLLMLGLFALLGLATFWSLMRAPALLQRSAGS